MVNKMKIYFIVIVVNLVYIMFNETHINVN